MKASQKLSQSQNCMPVYTSVSKPLKRFFIPEKPEQPRGSYRFTACIVLLDEFTQSFDFHEK